MNVGFVLLMIGVVQSIWMIWAIRTDAAANRISIIEAATLKLGNAEPSPKSRIGLAFDRLMFWIGLLFGLLFVVVGLFLIFAE